MGKVLVLANGQIERQTMTSELGDMQTELLDQVDFEEVLSGVFELRQQRMLVQAVHGAEIS